MASRLSFFPRSDLAAAVQAAEAEHQAELDELKARHEVELRAALSPASRTVPDEGFRRLGDPLRDLMPLTHSRMQQVAVYLWTYNPFARRIINILPEWLVGDGIKIEATDPRTQAYLDEWWGHPANRWDYLSESRVREYFLFGEQFWPVFANPYSGIMRVGQLDPATVTEVIPDPDNALVTLGVVRRMGLGTQERRYRTVLTGNVEETLSPAALQERERFSDGELFHFATNKLMTARRGISELFALSDWLDGYEQMLFMQLQQARALSNYMWDYQYEGMGQEEIDEQLKKMSPPKPFSVWGHNEKVKRELVGPPAGSGQSNSEHARLFRNQILGGAGYPEHWYGGGGDVNRSTADSMTDGTTKSLTGRQRGVRAMYEVMASAQVQRGIEVGVLRDTPEARDLSVTLPDLSMLDVSRASQGLQAIAGALAIGQDRGWVDNDTAARVLASLVAQTGVDVDAGDMLSRAQEELTRRMADEVSSYLEQGSPAPA